MEKFSEFSKSFLLNTKEILAFVLVMLYVSVGFSQPASSRSGWHFTNYSFKDGTLQKESVLAGTTSKMKDVIRFNGEKGNIEISQNRYDLKTGKLIAGVTYKVIWSDPPSLLNPGEKISVEYELKTISSLTWKPQQQTVYLNQGQGVYFTTSNGTKFITADLKSKLTSEKIIEKGSSGAKKTIQISFGNGFSATYTYEWIEGDVVEPISTENSGWEFINYSFKDGSLQKESVLAGTTSKMKDIISFKGDKGNIEISQNRYDEKTGKLIAGVTYKVIWSDPPSILQPGEKISIDYELETISSLTWKPQQQTVYMNQGQGVYFTTSNGTKFITADLKSKLTSEKVVEKGIKDAKRTIQVSLGNGFSATYNYKWREL